MVLFDASDDFFTNAEPLEYSEGSLVVRDGSDTQCSRVWLKRYIDAVDHK